MTVNQAATFVNETTKAILGEEAITTEDLSNIVDLGTALIDANAMDNWTKKLVDKVGRVIFVNRVYDSSVPSVLMESWEFGSIMQKISCQMPEAAENEAWNLQNGQTYNQDKFYGITVESKFFSKRLTFEIDMSIAEMQVKSAFTGAEQMTAFISMIYNEVEKSMTAKIDSLVLRTINSMIGQTLYNDFKDAGLGTKTTPKCVNLLKMYNDAFNAGLTTTTMWYDPEFYRFSTNVMQKYIRRLGVLSKLFNVGGQARFTPRNMLHFILLDDFKSGADAYLQSDTFHNNFTALPKSDIVPYWQGEGTDYGLDSVGKVSVTIPAEGAKKTVTAGHVLGVMFDRDALGVACVDRYTKSHVNEKGDFVNNFFKFFAGYFNDLNENFVVFYAA